MRKLSFILLLLTIFSSAYPCTNVIVTKGASADGSCMLVYTNDGEWLFPLSITPAQRHLPGDSIYLTNRWGFKTAIPQPEQTFHVIGFQMNEFQVAVGETTFVGREELWYKGKGLEYWQLMTLALERSTTAREAIHIMTSLAEKYGYSSEGESFSICDPNEAWILEMIGTGGAEGVVWVARKIPDGMISAHANLARIGEVPLKDKESTLYSKNLISFAKSKGYYDGKSEFKFNEVYCPATASSLRYCETRVWSIFRRANPEINLSPDYHRGVQGAERYPLFITPSHKLTQQEVFYLVREHYEGTPFYMGTGIDGGPFETPNRNRPLSWTDSTGQECAWERTISTPNTCFSYVACCRANLPNHIGGKIWFGVDDTWYTCYHPVYCQQTRIAEPFAHGDLNHYDRNVAFWAFNFVSNFSNLRYRDMMPIIQKEQRYWEEKFLSQADSIENRALKLSQTDGIEFLTIYSTKCGQNLHEAWIKLGDRLITKFNDGYIKDENGSPQTAPYQQSWLNMLMQRDDPNRFITGKQKKGNEYHPF